MNVFLKIIIGLIILLALSLVSLAQVPADNPTTLNDLWIELGKTHAEVTRLTSYVEILKNTINQKDLEIQMLKQKLEKYEKATTDPQPPLHGQ